MRQFCAAMLIGLTCSLVTGAESWDQFRGPRGNGHAAANLPIAWSETENVAWKTAIDGKAWSSPVVWGDQIWLTNATTDGKRLSAVCVDGRSGKIIRDVTVFEIAEPMYCIDYNSYASPTPVIEEGRLWVHYGSAGTACLDTTTGKVLWSRQDFPCDHHRGPGSSPVIFRDLVYLNFDGVDVQYIVALNKHTGETAWTDATSHDRSGFGAIVDAGSVLIALPSSSTLIVFKPEDRQYEQLAQIKISESSTYTHPVLAGNRVFVKDQDMLTMWTID